MSKAMSVGNVWVTAATIVKIALPKEAIRGEGYILSVGKDGAMQIIGPLTGNDEKIPTGHTVVCGLTVDTTVDRIAARLQETLTQ